MSKGYPFYTTTTIEIHLLWWRVAIHVLDVEWWQTPKMSAKCQEALENRGIVAEKEDINATP